MARSYKILIIEDDSTAAEMFAYELDRANLLKDWKQLNNKKDFKQMLKQKPDVIISESKLANFSALEALEIIKHHGYDIPFIVVSSEGNIERAVNCMKEGADDFITKGHLVRLPQAIEAAIVKCERRKKQKQMERALMLTKFAIDHASISIYWIGKDGRFLWVNDAGLAMTGYDMKNLCQKTIDEMDFALIGNNWKEFLQTIRKTLTISSESIFRHQSGQTFPVEFTANYFRLEGREYVLLFSQDISKRKKAEAENARLATAIEQAAESIMITDVKGKILYVNPAFTQISGYSREDVIGRSPGILLSGEHDEQFYRDLWSKLLKGQSWHGHFKNKRKDGELFEEEATISPIKDKEGKIFNFVAVKRDVTQEVNLQKQFNQSQKMEAIGRMAGGVAHDFNNLLTIINGYSELILNEMDANNPFYNSIEQILKAIKRGSNLTRQLLAFSRRQQVEIKTVDLNTIITETIKMLKHILEEDVSVETQMDQEFKFIEADPGQIGQIILNLAVNAKDAMPSGGKLIISTSKTSVDEKYCKARLDLQPGDYIKLSVSDTGTGMSESVKNKIFEPFFTTKESGTGLGLSTVFGIVKQNKGYIECKSEINEGSVFDIYFPIATPPGIPDAEPTESHSLPRGNETILLVEDEEDVRILTAKMLRLQGYKVIEAQDGNTALATSKKLNGNIDLLITDVIMPRMSGAELAVHLKNNQPDMQVLYISGYASSVMERQNKDINASFMQKPFTFENILYKVRDILDKSFAVET